MPLYTFRCGKCGNIIQVTHGVNEAHPEFCQDCGGGLDRLFDVPSVHYLVSGFYTMDKRLTPVKPEDYNSDED
jgi:putative FmdB family regulatory protein